MKILVAEDDASSRILLEKFLASYGECHIALNGKEAVDTARRARQDRKSFDLICMDLGMPEMSGLEAIREIRRQEATSGSYKTAKIVVTTSHSDLEDITAALQGGCNAYLVKPIETAKLLETIKKLGLIEDFIEHV